MTADEQTEARRPEDRRQPGATDGSRVSGRKILSRIALRELSQGQIEFLSELTRTPIGGHLVLAGSAALHGVYLHRRWAGCLDFYAPSILGVRFVELARRQGLRLEYGSTRNAVRFAVRGRVFPRLEILARVFPKADVGHPSEPREFRGISGATVVVRALPLERLLAVKLGLLFWQARPVDFCDCWLGLRISPEIKDRIRAVLNDPTWSRGMDAPPAPFPASDVLHRLAELRGGWDAALEETFPAPPPFDQVWEELREWLPFFGQPLSVPARMSEVRRSSRR